MCEELMVRHASPTLAGLKTGSLFSCPFAGEQAMQDVARLEAELADLKSQPVDVAVETVVDQAAIDKARAEAVAEMQATLDKGFIQDNQTGTIQLTRDDGEVNFIPS